jgi:hypothetical protein
MAYLEATLPSGGPLNHPTRLRVPWGLPALAPLLLVPACADPPPPASDLEIRLDTVAGIPHVRNLGEPASWDLEPVLRLGALEGGPEEFGRVRSLLADAEGRIYVAETMTNQVRVFSPEGRHERTFGRRGEGPGEFASLYSLAWMGDDLAAMDPGNARIALLSPEGEWRGMIRHFAITGGANVVRLHPLGEEGFYAQVIDPNRPGLPWARMTAEGTLDTIPVPRPPPDARQTGVVCHRTDGGITFISLPDSPGIVYGFPPPGGTLAVSWTEEYRIAFVGGEGDTVRVVTRDRPPPPYPDELWEEGLRPWHELREMFPGMTCDPGAPRRPRHRAALRHLMFDEAGRMWVEAAAEVGFVWEVFDPEGRLLGQMEAPPRAQGIPPYVRDGRLYQVETDEMDVPGVGVYRVRPLEGV